jgi:hypothetical protein
VACPVWRGSGNGQVSQLSAIIQVRWVSKSRVVWHTLEESLNAASLRAHQ